MKPVAVKIENKIEAQNLEPSFVLYKKKRTYITTLNQCLV